MAPSLAFVCVSMMCQQVGHSALGNLDDFVRGPEGYHNLSFLHFFSFLEKV